ncbi:phytanoyl-CoA dioxygenase family protein [Sphaerisporangium sp. NPDC051017]|uniref:phytanoyl-CoA dioxygenase family protein n=1 Tax=Sphaerisporangium sp. NPDC051017 TaxID=3154636 RepID=UPI003425C6DF
MAKSLTDAQVEQFVEEGVVRVDGAFSAELAETCRTLLWNSIDADPDDRTTWTEPVVRVWDREDEPFRQAANTPRLLGAFDQICGEGRWVPPASMGTFPIRFPLGADPGDTMWHVDGSYKGPTPGWYWINVSSRERALLMLFLFSDTGDKDAPTRMRLGSHLYIPPLLEHAGEEGISLDYLLDKLDGTDHLPEAQVVGEAGTVYLCHPFLVHAAQPHHGTEPRFMAQPALLPSSPLQLHRADGAYSPVERAIRLGLDRTRVSEA